jgi:hypothetical protein
VKQPHRVALTDHAAERAEQYGVPWSEVADAVLGEHGRRRTNPGAADWLVQRGRLVVVYNWPDAGDESAARVVSLWIAG